MMRQQLRLGVVTNRRVYDALVSFWLESLHLRGFPLEDYLAAAGDFRVQLREREIVTQRQCWLSLEGLAVVGVSQGGT